MSTRPVFLLMAALLLPAVSRLSAAELEWNQDRVVALAQDLIEPLDALRGDLQGRPPVPGKEAEHAAVVNALERLRLRVGELAQRLASGAGRAETAALFHEIETLQSQAARLSSEYPAPFDMHVYVDRVQASTLELARYYGKPLDSRGGSAK